MAPVAPAGRPFAGARVRAALACAHAFVLLLAARPASAQAAPTATGGAGQYLGAARGAPRALSAPIRDVRYEVHFDDTTALRRAVHVVTTFELAGAGPVLLSLPAWTPGSYEIDNFARFVSAFRAHAITDEGKEGAELAWDKADFDTWRIQPGDASRIAVTFDVLAATFDNAFSWATPDFAFLNGTNLFMYPEGRGTDWGATVALYTRPDWRVATGMTPVSTVPGGPRVYRERNYHDLVDMPFFVGEFDLDSMRIADRWVRMATYPASALSSGTRQATWRNLAAVIPPETRVFRDTPFATYTLLQVIDSTTSGSYSGLEHQNSHLDVISADLLATAWAANLYAHEIFHAWNVKRLRPADLVPYDYDAPQPTSWLWVSEGITDYYGNLAVTRGGLLDGPAFYALVADEMAEVEGNPPVSLEDASLDTWIKPVAGSASIYYQKGALAGLALDIMIRDASDNRRSLDDVMRALYETTWRQGRGFTSEDWWGTVTRTAGRAGGAGLTFADFRRRFIEGREPFPWDAILPVAGLRIVRDTVREPRLGVSSNVDSTGAVIVTGVDPASVAEAAGLREGDVLVRVGEVPVDRIDWGTRFRARYGKADGAKVPILVRRGGQPVTLTATVRLTTRITQTVGADEHAPPRAVRIRQGILTGADADSTTPAKR